MMKLHILLVTDAYPPEIRSASHLMQELAEGLRDRGHKVTVITSYPKYNLTEDVKIKVFNELTAEDGIDVIRVKTLPHHKVNFIVRGVAQITMPYIFLSKIKNYIKDSIDVVIVYSPPLPLTKVGETVKRKYSAKFIVNVQDIFPQNAIDLGILNSKLLIRFFENFEKKAYLSADSIIVHSEGNRNFLVKNKQLPLEKVHVLHNWIDVKSFIGLERTDIFRKKYGIDGKFVFLFAGVIGPSQGLDLIVQAAEQLKDLPDICFLIVGDGMEKERLEKMVIDLKLRNIIFQPFVSKDEYPLLVKEADVGLVCLTSKNKTPVVPGKILGYMAASAPVIAFLNKESDGHKIIKDAGCGYSEVSDNIDKVVGAIRRIYSERNKMKEYGVNGFTYVNKNFEKNICINHLEEIISSNK